MEGTNMKEKINGGDRQFIKVRESCRGMDVLIKWMPIGLLG